MVAAMSNQVCFHGRKPREELLKMLVKSDFSIFMRKKILVTKAGFPTKFSESIAYGTPVITNLLENIEPYFEEDKNGVAIDNFDRAKSVARLQEVLGYSQAKILAMKEGCLKSETFSYRAFCDPVEQMFDKLSDQKH